MLFSVAIDNRHARIASGGGGGDRNIVLQTFPALTKPNKLRGVHLGPIGALAFDGAGTMLASAANDGTVVLWDLRTLLPIGPPLAAHESIPHDIRFAPGDTLLASSDDENVLFWDVRLSSWKRIACEQANRQLSRDEWTEGVPDEKYRQVCSEKLMKRP